MQIYNNYFKLISENVIILLCIFSFSRLKQCCSFFFLPKNNDIVKIFEFGAIILLKLGKFCTNFDIILTQLNLPLILFNYVL